MLTAAIPKDAPAPASAGQTQRKAVALISGGLDSLLAARVVIEQGIHVEGLNFFTGFCVEGHTHAIRSKDRQRPKRNNALWVAEQLGIRLHFVDVVEEYKRVVINPKHGYGSNLNPCLDCKSFMVGKAYEWIQEHGFDFIITGEVVGQRPMSQRKDTMPVIARESGAGDRLLRPLCAKHMPESLPEREGWIHRDALWDFHGRSRKPQMALAKHFGHQSPVLGEAHGPVGLSGHPRLRTGRHHAFEGGPASASTSALQAHHRSGRRRESVSTSLRTTSHGGPLTLVDGEVSEDDLLLAARLTARYSQGRDAAKVEVEVTLAGREARLMSVAPFPADDIPAAWHI